MSYEAISIVLASLSAVIAATTDLYRLEKGNIHNYLRLRHPAYGLARLSITFSSFLAFLMTLLKVGSSFYYEVSDDVYLGLPVINITKAVPYFAIFGIAIYIMRLQVEIFQSKRR